MNSVVRTVQIDREQSTRVTRKQWVDADNCAALKMGE